jgi:hypothetical protein
LQPAGWFGDKWHLDEVVISIGGKKHWLWRAVDKDDPVANLFHIPRHQISSDHHRQLRTAAMQMWNEIAHLRAA